MAQSTQAAVRTAKVTLSIVKIPFKNLFLPAKIGPTFCLVEAAEKHGSETTRVYRLGMHHRNQ